MTSPVPAEIGRPAAGLRERKKARTRVSIRTEAIRLFREQGYAATTIEQIAEAAEISPSTFFRYFPTMEAVVVTDDYDPLLIEAFRGQPAGLSPIRAFRESARTVLVGVDPADWELEEQRQSLIMSEPELRSATLDFSMGLIDVLAEVIGTRAGRSADDLTVRSTAGAIMGVCMALLLESWDGKATYTGPTGLADRIDKALEVLERGLPL
jgi:AcrR family transcriptional regulator